MKNTTKAMLSMALIFALAMLIVAACGGGGDAGPTGSTDPGGADPGSNTDPGNNPGGTSPGSTDPGGGTSRIQGSYYFHYWGIPAAVWTFSGSDWYYHSFESLDNPVYVIHAKGAFTISGDTLTTTCTIVYRPGDTSMRVGDVASWTIQDNNTLYGEFPGEGFVTLKKGALLPM